MTTVFEAAPDIYQVQFDNDSDLTNCEVYLLRGEVGAVIEAGPAALIPQVLEALRLLRWDYTDIAYVIPTHLHLDHGGGAGALTQALPQAKVVAHCRGARHFVNPSELIEGTREAFGPDFERTYGAILPVLSERVLGVADGEVLDLGGKQLQILYTPGHAPHHMSVLDKETKSLFCGDALGRYFPELDLICPTITLPMFDRELARDSTAKMRQVGAGFLAFSHGGVCRNVNRMIDLAEEAVDVFCGMALEALGQNLSVAELAARFRDYHRKLVAGWADGSVPEKFRDGLKKDYTNMAKALLAYHKKASLA